MAIYTSYLARLKADPKMPEKIGACFVYIVTTRVAENRAVAPDWDFLNKYKAMVDCEHCTASEARDPNTCDPCHEKAWAGYEEAYLNKIQKLPEARRWIQRRSSEAIINNILLVCLEKNSIHCHRRLLAEEIARFVNPEINGKHAEYRGDWND